MITVETFAYRPLEHEREKASGSYIMSLVAIVVGLPLPIVNLIATFIFWTAYRNSTYFVRWHCTQALLSQASFLLVNSVLFWWSMSIFFGDGEIDNLYISYVLTAVLFNLVEFIATIYTAIQTSKGIHVHWWFFGDMTDLIVKAEK